MNKNLWKALIFLVLVVVYAWAFPRPLFSDPYSTLVLDREGRLLSARIADDGQWRFPVVDTLPSMFIEAVVRFEDRNFFYHPGVDPIALVRATLQNMEAGKVVSGGSTISMQVIRLARKGRDRTLWEKVIEAWLAIRLEFSYSKKQVMQLYASHAPYGGNVVGVEAASWRYFDRPLEKLSTAEYAMLAVLPNAPALIHPGRNRDRLKEKRDRLLHGMMEGGIIDSVEYSLSIMEPLPRAPHSLPSSAFHLLDRAVAEGMKEQRVSSTVDGRLQRKLTERLENFVSFTAQNEVHNAAAIVVDIHRGDVLAYVGNAMIPEARSPFVDIIRAPRSSGSILKPFLYGRAFEEGLLHPQTLVRDVPVSLGNFTPENYDGTFQGVVPAGEALARSLNVPAALLLRDYGIVPFREDLESFGFSTISQPAMHYGLALILGGAEVTLWDLARVYTDQCQGLRIATGEGQEYREVGLWSEREQRSAGRIDPAAWWQVANALTEVQRPELQQDWRKFSSSRRIAWKTGTSHGFRDAWAVGFDKDYLVGVWVGNADGEGRPGLTGVSTAAPLMFDAFQLLPSSSWYEKPTNALRLVQVCSASGLAPALHCPKVEAEVPMDASSLPVCDLHKEVLLNASNERVFHGCGEGTLRDTVWFSLDPVAGYFFGRNHADYRPLPRFSEQCSSTDVDALAIIYPQSNANVIVPRDLSGSYQNVQFQAAHSDRDVTLFWHLDDAFIGTTELDHTLEVLPGPGVHNLMVMDEMGNRTSVRFRASMAYEGGSGR